MSKPWISDGRQRASKRYLEIHRKLRAELLTAFTPIYDPIRGPTKQARKAAKARDYRQNGGGE